MTAKYAFINSEEGNYSIRSMCRWARVSRAGYYEWLNRPVSVTQRWRDELGDIIEVLFADSDATYGYRRIHAALVRAGRPCDPQTVRAIMAERGLVACQPRRSGPRTTIPADAKDLPDLVNRDFTADDGPVTTVYDAAQNYAAAGTPLVVLAGKEYGSGSSRDWAAKGTALLGVKVVIAES